MAEPLTGHASMNAGRAIAPTEAAITDSPGH
jgi:hypothetical protein